MAHARIEQLTGLRFIAALGVLLSHFSILLPTDELKFLWTLGGHGVILFFVLSGFVLTLRYDGKINDKVDMQKYAIARFSRIIPVYWLLLGITAIVYSMTNGNYSLGPKPDNITQTAWSFFLNAVAMQAWFPNESIQQYWNAPGWSVSAEFFFYACLPWLLKLRFLDGTVRAFIVVTLGFLLIVSAYFIISWMLLTAELHNLAFMFAARIPLFGLFSFILGILCCRLIKKYKIQESRYSTHIYTIITTITFSSWVIHENNLSIIYMVFAQNFFYAVLFAILITLVSCDTGWIGSFLKTPILVLLGNASYTLYLLHWLPLGIAIFWLGAGQSSYGIVTMITASLIIASIVINLFFETPIRNYLIKIKK